MKFIKVTCCIGLAFFTSCLFAAGSSNSDDVYRVGVSPGVYSITIDDPDGDTENASGFNFLQFIGTYNYGRDAQLFAHFFVDDYSLDPGVNTVGQDINGYGLSISYQKRLRLSRNFRPWIGAGIGMAQYDYKSRFTIDASGFLDQTFSNREENLFYITLNANTDWQWNNTIDFIVSTYINSSLDNQYLAMGLSFGILY